MPRDPPVSFFLSLDSSHARVYFLCSDNSKKNGMSEVQIRLSGQPKCIKNYTLIFLPKQPKRCVNMVALMLPLLTEATTLTKATTEEKTNTCKD